MEFFTKQENEKIKCTACARYCEIEKGSVGYCGVRKNMGGNLKLLNFGKIIFLKKQRNKMLVGALGSNMRISFDANWDTSLYPFLRSDEVGRAKTNEEIENLGYKYTPNQLVDYARKKGCDEIVFQFNEPLVYLEYILEVCKLREVKVSIVTTGYFSKESLKIVLNNVNTIYFVLFSTFDKFYIKHCNAQLPIIKENLKEIFKSKKVDLKIFVPLIPEENDIVSVCKFLKNISPLLSVSFLSFVPSFRMLDKEATNQEDLKNAVEVAKKVGLQNVDFVG